MGGVGVRPAFWRHDLGPPADVVGPVNVAVHELGEDRVRQDRGYPALARQLG
jgi:hypothetical protein